MKLPHEFQLGALTQIATEVTAIAVQEFTIHGGAASALMALGTPRYHCQDVRIASRQRAHEIIDLRLAISEWGYKHIARTGRSKWKHAS